MAKGGVHGMHPSTRYGLSTRGRYASYCSAFLYFTSVDQQLYHSLSQVLEVASECLRRSRGIVVEVICNLVGEFLNDGVYVQTNSL